jgi:CHASE2 domain-containing sensor protein
MAPDRIPRTLHAALIDRLHRDGARLIAYDVQLVGHKDAAGDAALTRAISAARPVLLATHDTEAGPVPVPAGERHPERRAVIGSVGVPTDSDGEVRRMLYAPVQLQAFAIRAAELMLGDGVSERNFPDNSAWIDYAGPVGTFPTISIADAAAGRVPPATFRGKAVLVGYTDPALLDLVQTPVSGTPMPGVEVHANALATILGGFPLRQAPGWFDVLLVLALSALPGVLALRLPALYVLGGSLAALAHRRRRSGHAVAVRRSAGARSGGTRRRPGRRRAGRGTRPRPRPSRRQARKRAGRDKRRRPRVPDRLRPQPPRRLDEQRHQDRDDDGDAGLHAS